MKNVVMYSIMACLLGGCGAVGIEKLASCGECLQGIQELGQLQDISSLMKAAEKGE